VHPLQGGYLRRKIRRTRRPGSPHNNVLLFYVRHWTATLVKLGQLAALVWRINGIRRRVAREHARDGYTDMAIAKLPDETEQQIDIMRGRRRLEIARAD
jgi:hypothetical protein